MQPRFLQVDSGDVLLSHVEVLEAFKYGQVYREFNVRLRRGVYPTDVALMAEIRKQFNVPAEYVGNVLPLAGDRTVRFDPPAGGTNVKPMGTTGSVSVPRNVAGLLPGLPPQPAAPAAGVAVRSPGANGSRRPR